MKVTISVGGRFHAFYLAYQLEKRGYLQKLITSYPKFETVKYGVPRKKIYSIIIKEVLERGWRKLPRFLTSSYNPQFFIHEIYDEKAKSKLPKDMNLFIGWSSFSFHTLRKAKNLGATTIVERGSSHIEYQQDILKEEYEKFKGKINLPHPKIIEKELKEYEETDYVEVPSTFVKRTFLDRGYPEDKIILGFRGVDLSEFKQIPKEDNVFRVIFAGGMSLRKGVHYLLQAFAELGLPNSELILIGSINDEIKPFFKKYEVEKSKKQEINKLINQGSRIRFIGHIPQKELHKYYSQGSVFILPSIEDGFGVVITQAMACGLPVIATENTGGPDIIDEGENGFIVPIRNVDAFEEKITYLYENPDILKKMSESAKKRVSSGFTWDDYGEKITEKYKNILNNYER